MEEPLTAKQENVDYFATKPSVKIETNILDSTKIKLEHVKLEPHLYVPEPNNLVQKCNMKEEAKLIENDDKCILNCLLNEISKQKGSEIKQEGSEAIDGYEKIDDVSKVKKEIKDEELVIKDEINIEDQEQRWGIDNMILQTGNHCEYETTQKKYLKTHLDFQTVRKKSLKTHKNSSKVDIYKCDQCDYQTVRKDILRIHSLKYKHSHKVDMYKCDQCEFETFYKFNLKRHILSHKNADKVDMYKCDQCKYQTVHKQNLERHNLKHSDVVNLNMYKKKFNKNIV